MLSNFKFSNLAMVLVFCYSTTALYRREGYSCASNGQPGPGPWYVTTDYGTSQGHSACSWQPGYSGDPSGGFAALPDASFYSCGSNGLVQGSCCGQKLVVTMNGISQTVEVTDLCPDCGAGRQNANKMNPSSNYHIDIAPNIYNGFGVGSGDYCGAYVCSPDGIVQNVPRCGDNQTGPPKSTTRR